MDAREEAISRLGAAGALMAILGKSAFEACRLAALMDALARDEMAAAGRLGDRRAAKIAAATAFLRWQERVTDEAGQEDATADQAGTEKAAGAGTG